MAILSILMAENITKDMYESLRQQVDWEHKHPAGLILHSAAFDATGKIIRVADIWESEDELNNFVSDRLMPVMQKAGVSVPKVEVFQINDVSTYPGIERYKVRQ